MTKKHSNRKYRFIIPAILIAIFFSCTDKKEYNMELAFQRQMTAEAIRENDRLVKRVEKEIADNGDRPIEVAIRKQAQDLVKMRNKYIDSLTSVLVLIENIKPVLQQAGEKDRNALTLLHYYQEELKQKSDSLIFQKFINVYLTFEKEALEEILGQVSGSCNWGLDMAPHVIKTTDTVAIGQAYEFAVVPETFDYKASYVNDDFKLKIYRNDTLIDIKSSIERRGFVYLVSVSPDKIGTYKISGLFSQTAYAHPYILANIFNDTFVVK